MYVFPSAIPPSTSRTVVGGIVSVQIIHAILLVLAQLLGHGKEYFPKLSLDDLFKIHAIMYLFSWLGPGCAPIPIDWSANLVKTVTVRCAVALVWPSMLSA